MVSLENRKMLRIRLRIAREHASLACNQRRPDLAAREIHAAIANLTIAIDLLADALNRRPEFYSGALDRDEHDV
jgi:hypothetical protein